MHKHIMFLLLVFLLALVGIFFNNKLTMMEGMHCNDEKNKKEKNGFTEGYFFKPG